VCMCACVCCRFDVVTRLLISDIDGQIE